MTLLGKTIKNRVVQDVATFVHTSKETGGEKSVLEITLFPGGGAPLHYHKTFSEVFEVLEGELMVQTGKTKQRLKVGDSAKAEKEMAHRFYSESSEPVKFRVTLTPGHEGFEQCLAITYGLAEDGLTNKKGIPKGFRRLAILIQLGETYLPGPLKLIGPLMTRVANSKKSQKLKQELVQKYC